MCQHPPSVGVSRRITVKSYGVGLIPFKCQALEGALWRFTDESVAEPRLTAQRRPNRVICPKCLSDNAAEPDDHKPLPFRCCRPRLAQFSFKSHISVATVTFRVGKGLPRCSPVVSTRPAFQLRRNGGMSLGKTDEVALTASDALMRHGPQPRLPNRLMKVHLKEVISV